MLSLARQFTLICRSSIWDLHQGVSMGKTCSAVLHGEGDGLAPWLQYLLSKPFVPQLLFLKRHNLHNIANNIIYTSFFLDPWLWPCEDGWGRNDRLCCNTLVQSTRNHAQLDALQPNRLLCIFILKLLRSFRSLRSVPYTVLSSICA